MAISIDTYSSWANSHMTTEAAINKGTGNLEDASKRVGSFARFFGLQAAQDVRSTVMTDFTRALSARYGLSLAQHALAEAGLTPTSKLDGQTIHRVIDCARARCEKAVDASRSGDIRLMTGTVTAADIRGYGPGDKSYVRNYMFFRLLAIDALGETPLDADSLQDFTVRVASIKKKLASAMEPFSPAKNSMPGVSMSFPLEAQELVKALDKKVAEAGALLANKPLSPANQQEFKHIWREAALRTLATLGNGKPPALRTALDTISQYLGSGAADGLIPVSKEVKTELAELLINMIKAQTQSMHGSEFKSGDIAKLLSANYQQVLNERPWPVIDKTFTAVVNGQAMELQSVITPGQHIGEAANAASPIGSTYDRGVNGYMCHSARTPHAVNLAVSSLTVKDASGAEQLAFRGVRHGVHCAWEISGSAARAPVNAARAKEAVIAAFFADPANVQKIPPGQTVYTVNLSMTSVSLLTPDILRHIKWGRSSDERLQLQEQMAAWEAVEKTGVTFQYDGKTINIKPKITMFNFGVNTGAVNHGANAPDLFGWDMADAMNTHSFRHLAREAMEFVSRLQPNDPRRKAIFTLLDQCATEMTSFGEHSDNHDAYKLAARVAVITHLIGGMPCWNCKSGKDRTGEMDVECKFLSALIARGADIPAPGAPLTDEQKGLFRAIALEGGNFELQKLNTGFAGYKTEDVDSIPERLGGQEYRDLHAGGSPFVSV